MKETTKFNKNINKYFKESINLTLTRTPNACSSGICSSNAAIRKL